jgi:hypothetical protein
VVAPAQPEKSPEYDWQIDKNENEGIKQHVSADIWPRLTASESKAL